MVAGNEPRQFRVIFSKQALSDLDELTAYIRRSSPQNATAYAQRIVDAIDGLQYFPNRNVMSGQSVKLPNPVRTLPVESHIVYFRVNDKRHSVTIVRILHGARRRPRHF